MKRAFDKDLARDLILDLITEVRCARRDGLEDYAAQTLAHLRRVLEQRHNPKLDRYGYID